VFLNCKKYKFDVSINFKFTLSILLKIILVILPLFFYFRFWISPYLIMVYEVILAILFLIPFRYQSKILANIENVTNRLPVSAKRKKSIINNIKRIIF
jgi:hypothetical protein